MPGGRTAARVSYDVLENGQVFQLPPTLGAEQRAARPKRMWSDFENHRVR